MVMKIHKIHKVITLWICEGAEPLQNIGNNPNINS